MANIENLDQIRAKNAWNACNKTVFANVNGGDVVKDLSPMIRENGMLGALAFAIEKANKAEKKRKDAKTAEAHEKIDNEKGVEKAFDAISIHLRAIGKVSAADARALQNELLECTSLKLRDVTAETMLYLDYLRRFGKTKGDNNE